MLKEHWFPVCLTLAFMLALAKQILPGANRGAGNTPTPTSYDSLTNEWSAPDINLLSYDDPKNDSIRYGHDLFTNTSYYFGPSGKIAAITNGMNCQSCHLVAGTVKFGNCLSAVAPIYPVYRPRSGRVESIVFRVNDCLQRSLNGSAIDSNSKEMKSLVAYIKWLGKDVPKGVKPTGANTEVLPYLDRAADTVKGLRVYVTHCQRCHGVDGEGAWKIDHSGFIYPPLWGPNSYNVASGFYGIVKFASFVKNNMPRDSASYAKNVLSVEDAWDVAAYVNSRPHPIKKFDEDWPDLSKKSIDQPFGPYPDGFSEQQHKYGPFKPIIAARTKK